MAANVRLQGATNATLPILPGNVTRNASAGHSPPRANAQSSFGYILMSGAEDEDASRSLSLQTAPDTSITPTTSQMRPQPSTTNTATTLPLRNPHNASRTWSNQPTSQS